MEVLMVARLHPDAVIPERKSALAAGYDIASIEDLAIAPGASALVGTGLAMRCPTGTYIRIAPRSGLAVKGIHVGAGVIDQDYTGHVKVLLCNHGQSEFRIAKGDRIAQAVIERILTPSVMVVEALEDTERGAGGFGSTGTGTRP
jgi:dUTP pyrophosphatase